MHELGIAESAARAAIEEMRRHGGQRIVALTLRIGDLAAVDAEALRFAFEAVSAGTALEGAELAIENVPGIAWCSDCREEFTAAGGIFFKCPHCGNFSGELRGGREIELARLELE